MARKGRQVAVEGRLRWREWETADGQKRSTVSVVADKVQFLGQRESQTREEAWHSAKAKRFVGGHQPDDDPDDDIPF